MFKLDEIDKRIVRELQRDASWSVAALGERVGASGASVWRRVRNLEAGAEVNVDGPYGDFLLPDDDQRPVVEPAGWYDGIAAPR